MVLICGSFEPEGYTGEDSIAYIENAVLKSNISADDQERPVRRYCSFLSTRTIGVYAGALGGWQIVDTPPAHLQ
jgi:hypothetical protein